MELLIGSNVGFVKGKELLGAVEETLEYNANSFMFYTGPNQSSQRNELNEELTNSAQKLMKINNIDINNVFVHAPFIINLANNLDERKYNFYISFLRQEIERCKYLGINNLILHPGSATIIERQQALDNIVFGLNMALEKIDNFNLIIEFMSGKGTELCSNIDEISYVLKNVNKEIYVCLDTCHMNDSGIDISKFDDFLQEFDEKIGINKIKCIHLNDSYNSIGEHKDRHANIGYGSIGFENILKVVYNEKLKSVPKILETPYIKGNSPYKTEIEIIKSKIFYPFIQ